MSDKSLLNSQFIPSQISYPITQLPLDGDAIEVAPGIFWFRMPLGLSLSHINLWAIADDHGWTIVDTGLCTPEAIALWQIVANKVLDNRPIKRIIVTHMHPDHVGMAGWLTKHYDTQLWMTALEYMTCRVMVSDSGREAPNESLRFYQAAGWDETAIESFKSRFGFFGKFIDPLPESYIRLFDGQAIRIGAYQWNVIIGSGHSPEHACLYCPELKVFISGDQVLPKISSNVSVFPTEPFADPLLKWLTSLEKIKHAVPDDVLVLPAHNEPFIGLHARLYNLSSGHIAALNRLRRLLTHEQRAVDVFSALFSRMIPTNSMLLTMATGEAIAHLNYLVARGQVVVRQDVRGVNWYTSCDANEEFLE